MTTNRINELESIRGIAALLVVMLHLPAYYRPFYELHVIRNLYLMVEVFFVLSGYVIYKNYSNRVKNYFDLQKFMLLRFGRLFPIHFLFLLFFLTIEFMKFFNLGGEKAFSHNTVGMFTTNLFLIQAIGFNHSGSYNVPSWSISVEFYTYLLFALIMLSFNGKNKVIVSVAVVVTSLLAYYVINGNERFEFILRCFVGFFTGCLTSMISESLSEMNIKFRGYAILFVLLAILFLLFSKEPESKVLDPVICLLSALLIISIVHGEGRLKSILRFPFFVFLGTISYSVYMSHWAVFWLVNKLLITFLNRPLVVIHKPIPQLSVGEAWVAYVLAILCVIIVSSVSYKFVEKPCRDYSRRIVSDKFGGL